MKLPLGNAGRKETSRGEEKEKQALELNKSQRRARMCPDTSFEVFTGNKLNETGGIEGCSARNKEENGIVLESNRTQRYLLKFPLNSFRAIVRTKEIPKLITQNGKNFF